MYNIRLSATTVSGNFVATEDFTPTSVYKFIGFIQPKQAKTLKEAEAIAEELRVKYWNESKIGDNLIKHFSLSIDEDFQMVMFTRFVKGSSKMKK